MIPSASATLLRGVDVAAFATALVEVLRRHGVGVSAVGAANFSEALHVQSPRTRTQLYWTARITLINRQEDLEVFDAQFARVFVGATLGLDPIARRVGCDRAVGDAPRAVGGASRGGREIIDVPWIGRATSGGREAGPDQVRPGLLLPSALAGKSEEPFAQLSPSDLALLGQWLEQAEPDWPKRRRRRRRLGPRGTIDLRASMSTARRTGFEFVRLARARPQQRPRTIVVLCDVSRSMHGYADMYLHLMRVAARRGDAEVFAFSTTLTRLTPILAHRSADAAIAEANTRVVDRYGGTHIGTSIASLLASHHGHTLRGAVVIIASDGWDSDEPDILERAMARVRRRAHRVVWLNPRAGATGFEPLTGSMAAALPYCDTVLPADRLTALRALFTAVSDAQ
ncbi:VWA domain-containing protein [Rhodococcus sp. NPDC056743]|uniref:vWA domain-containing protein n=1 Tax=Rhodococcus sp. NPDC056743 TaxID=3345934 RepID=UPI00366ED5B9